MPWQRELRIPSGEEGWKHQIGQMKVSVSELTVMIDGVDEPQADVSVVVGHEHHIKQLLALRVNLSQSCIYSLQSLGT